MLVMDQTGDLLGARGACPPLNGARRCPARERAGRFDPVQLHQHVAMRTATGSTNREGARPTAASTAPPRTRTCGAPRKLARTPAARLPSGIAPRKASE